MHLVDEVDLVPALGRLVLYVLEDFPGVVDLGPRGGIDLDEVDEPALVDLAAGLALAAGAAGDALLAVEALGHDSRNCRLADAARAAEEVGMVDPAALE